jgi:hypothetical protein
MDARRIERSTDQDARSIADHRRHFFNRKRTSSEARGQF